MKVQPFDISTSKSKSAVIFYSGSNSTNYLRDVEIGIQAFKHYGLPEQSLHAFVPDSWHPQLKAACPAMIIGHYVDFLANVPKLSFENVIAVVTGHGSSDGIVYHKPGTEEFGGVIRSHEFYTALKSIAGVKLVIPVLGQCYAGLFHFVDASSSSLSVCAIGATGLHSSLNSTVEQAGFVNVFLFYFHLWFFSPIDVNGDKRTTLLDCFQFAGANTSDVILASRSTWYRNLRNNEDLLRNPHLEDAKRQAIVDEIKRYLDAMYSVQEPWCLNVNQFREVLF